jgi:CMP-N-acetylneuraminic acid synthetase
MNKIVIIGARGESQRVKNKNLRLINNTPLIIYTIHTAQFLGCPIYVSSDSDLILETVNQFTVAHTIKRPETLATCISTDYDWIHHLILEVYKETDEMPLQLIFLRPTTPLRDQKVVRKAVDSFDSSRYTSLRSVEYMKESAFKTFTIDNGYLTGLSHEHKDLPNQLVPQTYSANGYVDILQTRQIVEIGDIYGDKIQPFITENTVEIDTEEDINYANYLLRNKNEICKDSN